jgi:hypothetical protein
MAWFWARKFHARSPAVFKATLILGYCIDMDDVGQFVRLIENTHQQVVNEFTDKGLKLPENGGDQLCLDCYVLNRVCESTIPNAESVVKTFSEDRPIYPGTQHRIKTQRQICMRNLNNILYPDRIYEDR